MMINLSRDIRSLSDFKRNTTELMDQMKATGDPVVLTVNGRAELIVQDAAAYQRMLEQQNKTGTMAGIQRGLKDIEKGRTRPAREAIEEIRKRRNIPRKP